MTAADNAALTAHDSILAATSATQLACGLPRVPAVSARRNLPGAAHQAHPAAAQQQQQVHGREYVGETVGGQSSKQHNSKGGCRCLVAKKGTPSRIPMTSQLGCYANWL
jgi:hypothetical protein